MSGIKFSEEHKSKISESQQKNTYTFYYSCGKKDVFRSFKQIGDVFGVKNNIISKWIKRKNLGRTNGTLFKNNVIKIDICGELNKIILPFEYRKEKWEIEGASSRTQYYREKRKNEIKSI